MGGAVYLRTMGERRRYGRRAALRGAGMAGATALLAACGGDNDRNSTGARTPATDVAAASPKMGGVLREATAVQSPHFSPFHPGADMSFGNYWRRVYGYYDYLWTFKDADIAERLHLMLASSTEQPDPTTVIVKLIPSRFHDRAPANGREVTADDVVETVRFLSKPPASGGQFLQSGKDLKSVTATDLSSVRFEMFGPRAFFYEELQGGIDLGKPIVPKEMLDEKTLKEAIPVGSGPYEYLRHTQGSSEAMRSFDSYRVNEQPYITERTVVFLPDAAAIEVGFRGNQIDTIRFAGVKQKDAVTRDLGDRIETKTLPSATGMALVANINRAPWNDIRAREALHRGIDIDRIISTVFFDDAVRTWYFSRARFDRSPLGPDALQPYIAYDPRRAANLLKAAGVDTSEEYEFVVPVEAPTWVDSARLIAEDLGKLGLKLRINPVVRNIYLQRAGPQPGDFDLTMSLLQDYANATSNSGTYWNSTSLRDPEIDALVTRIVETVDNQRRAVLSHEFETMLASKYANFVPILSAVWHYGWYARVKGVGPEFHPSQGLQAGRWIET